MICKCGHDISRHDKLGCLAFREPPGPGSIFCECELTQDDLRAAEAAALRATVAEQANVIALNKYVTPPFDLCDDDTVRLALECAAKNETIAEQAQTIETARDAIDKLVMRIKKFVDDNELDLWDAETLPEIISARAWLAANAPTPTTGETGPVSAWVAIDKAMTEHPELFSDDDAQGETESEA